MLDVLYQPIVSTLDGRVDGVEALARFPDGRPPDVWFADAAAEGSGLELELLAVERALDVDAGLLDDTTYIAVNVSPETLASPRLARLAAECRYPVVAELTEHTEVDDYDALVAAARSLRRHGVRLAVDDAGSGYAGLSHILKLRPDFIKLDRSLVTGVDTDPAKHALAVAVTDFGKAIGAAVVAEGVETMAEFHALVAAGIRLAQGYVVARPGRLPVETALPGGLRAPRVMVVDDDPVVRAFVRIGLERGGFRVVAEAEEARTAVAQAGSVCPDIIVLDVHMQDMSGDEAIPQLRTAAPAAMIVMISASRMKLDPARAPDLFLPKDDGLVDIASRLRRALADQSVAQSRVRSSRCVGRGPKEPLSGVNARRNSDTKQ